MPKRVILAYTLISIALLACARKEIDVIDPGGDEPVPEETTVQSDPELSWSESSCEAVFGAEDNNFPSLSNKYGVKVTYSSSDEQVASVDAEGVITLVGAGEAEISAVSAETEDYLAGSASFALTVLRAASVLYWSEDEAEVTLEAEDNEFPVLVNPGGLEVSFSSSDTSLATVSDDGEITLIDAGEVVISATSAETFTHEAAEASYSLKINPKPIVRTDSGLAWSSSEASVTYGSADNVFPTLDNPNELDITYSSSNDEIASISEEGEVTILSAGSVVITASNAETEYFNAGSVSYVLNVARAAAGLSWSESSCTVKMGGQMQFPTLENPNSLEVTYSSSNASVASVDELDGSVTVLSAGTATITASSAETATHEAGNVSYTLTVEEEDIILVDPGLSWSTASFEVTYGSSLSGNPTLSNPHSLSVSYSSSSEDVAKISEAGAITLVGSGSTVITASSEATDAFLPGSASYTLTVKRASAELSWSASKAEVTIGSDSNDFPTLTNSHSLNVGYSSSDKGVATVDKDGNVTLVAAGTAVITASSAETRQYSAGSASYTLTVNPKPKEVAGISWSASSLTVTIGSDDIVFPTLSNPNGLSVIYSSSKTSVATISDSGEVSIVAAGTARIYAKTDATDDYLAGSVYYTLSVVKSDAGLSWSASSCSATIDEDNDFPILDNPNALSVTYSSSNTSVAKIGYSNGIVTLVGAGEATITAKSSATASYYAGNASYTLTVIKNASGTDDGEGTYTYPSAGDTSSDDDISLTTFTRMITITYSDSGAASVSGDAYGYVTVSGNQVTVNNTGTENIVYMLTGSSSNGFFKLYSDKKQALHLSGLNLTNPSGAAINNQSGKRTFVYLEGSNSLADGSSASYSTTGTEDMKAVLFSEGQLVFSGSGSLSVTANNSKQKTAILSDDYVRIMKSPSITVSTGTSSGHGIKGKDYVQISGGTLGITSKGAMKKGIVSDNYVLVEGGTTTITVSGAVAYDSEDAEYKGSAGIKADNYFAMTAGTLSITNSATGGKGIRAGSYDYQTSHELDPSYISGGKLTIKTTGSKDTSHDVSAKGIKIGWVTKSSSGGGGWGGGEHSTVTGYAGRLNISGGTVEVYSKGSEGIESKGEMTISGGYVYGYSGSDDGINCAVDMTISGGYVCAWTGGNTTGADGFDANGNLYVKGGLAYGVCQHGSPDVAFDANTEGNKKLYVQGGTLIAVGGLESGASITGSAYKAGNWSKNTWYGLWNNSGTALIAFKTPSSGNSLVVYSSGSQPTLKSGVSYSGTSIFDGNAYVPGSISGGSSVSLSAYSGGGGGHGPGW